MKLMHISDIHFNIKFLNKDKNVRDELINAQRDTFKKVTKYLINNNIDALLIAGDLFDSEYRSMAIERFLIDEFNKLKEYNIKVFYALGNHDSNETFLESFFNALPDNVIIFKNDKSESYLLKEKLYIHSCGHAKMKENRNLVETFPKSIDEFFNVGLLHCSVVGSVNEKDIYLPTTIESLKSKKYDYWALGHIHKRMKIDENIYYSGSLQSLNSKETGDKGGLLVELYDEYSKVSFIPFKSISHLNLEIPLNELEIKTKYELFNYIEEKINQLENKTVLKVSLRGETELFSYLRDDNNLKEIKDMVLENNKIIDIKIKNDDLRRIIDIERYISDDNILGYIKKNYNDNAFIENIMKENNIINIDKDILKRVLDLMVDDSGQ